MPSQYNILKRGFSLTATVNKRQPISRLPRTVFDHNGKRIPNSLGEKFSEGDKDTQDFIDEGRSPILQGVQKRKELFDGNLAPYDYYKYLEVFDTKNTELPDAQENTNNWNDVVSNNKPHFRVGGNKVYLPEGSVILLPNLPNMSPYFARFRVPKTYNKLDLRDYLFNLYGLRVFNVTSSLTRRKYLPEKNSKGNYLTSQEKIMVVQMNKPFIWPCEIDTFENDAKSRQVMQQYTLFSEFAQRAIGSDSMKPCPKHIFEGIGGNVEPLPQPFIAKNVYQKWSKEIEAANNAKEETRLVFDTKKAIRKLDKHNIAADENQSKHLE